MLELHTWTTPNGKKPAILLAELGLPYELKLVNLDSLRLLNSGFRWIRPPDPFAG